MVVVGVDPATGIGKGSGRSQPGMNLGRAVQAAVLDSARHLAGDGLSLFVNAQARDLDPGWAAPLRELPAALVLYRPDWHQGVVGLVASRIKERFFRPVFAFAEADEHELKGSGRSIPGLHLRDALERLDSRYPGLISRFGGHAMAAGLTLPKAHLPDFEQHFPALVAEWLSPELLTNHWLSDGELAADELTLTLAEALRQGGPWGQAFAEPGFDGKFRLLSQRLVGGKHLKMQVRPEAGGPELDAIAFNVDLARWPDASVQWVELGYRLDINEWRNQRSVQLLVTLLKPL